MATQAATNLYCPQSEAAFIGCMVESQGGVLDESRATVEHFFVQNHRLVAGAVLALFESRSPVSVDTVLQKLGDVVINQIGGQHVVEDLCSYYAVSQATYFFGILEGKLALRRADSIHRWMGKEMEKTDDPAAFCADLQRKVQEIEVGVANENVLKACVDQIRLKLDRMERKEMTHAFLTKVPGWDAAFGGVLDGQLYGLAGRPGSGKTAMMEMLIGSYLVNDIPVTVFEKDMSPQKLIERMACRALGIEYWKLARGFLSSEEIEKLRFMMEVMEAAPLNLYNPVGLTAEKMCAIAKRDVRTKGSRAVFLDHIQTLRVGKDLREGLTMASLAIRANVTDTGVAHIILAHINRDGAKGGRPKPEHIKEFDQLYGDADGMAMLWSDADPTKLEKGEMLPVNFFAAKNRDGGQSDEEILFDGKLMKFHPQKTL